MTSRSVVTSLVAIASAIVVRAESLPAQSDSSKAPARVWLAASLTPAGHILGGGIERGPWRVGPELLRTYPGGLADGQLNERLVALTVSRLLGRRAVYVKAGFGSGRRWTEFSRVSAPFVQFGAGVVVPPRNGLRLSVDFTQSAATPAGQYPYSVLVGLGFLIKLPVGS